MRKTLLSLMLPVLVASTAWAELVPRGPILIMSDHDFTLDNGVVGGWGILGDPFVISGIRIDAGGENYGILISATTRPVLIRDVEILGARLAGIKVQSAKNVVIENVWVRGCATGISVFLSTNLSVSASRIEECPDGVKVTFSSQVELSEVLVSRCRTGVWFTGATSSLLVGSVVERCDVGVSVELHCEGIVVARNAILGCRIPAQSEGGAAWDDGARGNYWEGFLARDDNGDGILDRPYRVGVGEDRFPLASPPER
ncbi:MAG TPA: hypothetical protein ENN53_06465 [Candidatus Acetothermia bacterium]|nr:hypothetical protein [Candidatus Acetothermia bacterium]